MPTLRPFRFGIQFSGATNRIRWREQAIRAETLGYDVLVIPDHLGGQFAIGPALAVVAEATSTLRIATLVVQNDLRHPALVAMEAATLDVLSDGRFELGLGAGGSWMSDYDGTGIPFNTPGERVGRLQESLQIIKGLRSDGAFTFKGKFYAITDFDGQPKPAQKPRLPILVGGGGPRLLSLAAKEADIVSIFPRMLPAGGQFRNEESLSSAFARKIELLRTVAGERFAEIELNVLTQTVVITDNRRDELERLSGTWKISSDDLADSPLILIGSVAQIADHLRAVRSNLGISYFVIFGQFMETFAPVIDLLKGEP